MDVLSLLLELKTIICGGILELASMDFQIVLETL